ncbi:ABC transporter permease [Planctobacterium marinum]|uniref:Antimicrobial peptide ABC transporter permease SapB n=1 Tax=Planctobacterium marinum TaxID=1631968 RepID=A0AA48HG10_9ALTE|nr:antimicrobial peptide ABC transporter permease SapB [Planctobacterium marinum]
MSLYLFRRLNLLVFTLFMLAMASFGLAWLFPGDYLTNLTGVHFDTPEQRELFAALYKENEGVFWQFMAYLEMLWQGQWGQSFSSGQPLFQEILTTLPASIELSAYALFISLAVGIPLGFISGLKHNKLTDYSILSFSLVGYSIPVFWLALLLILVLSLQLGWFPISGRISLLYDIPPQTGFILIDILSSDLPYKWDAFTDALEHLVLPTLSISIVTSTIILRITRRSVIEVMSSEYIKAATAKGLNRTQVILRHGIRNTIIPIMPQLALQFTTLLTNAMIVESIFSWPGIGNWLLQAIYQGDYPAIRAGMLAVSSLVVIFTVFIDIIHKIIDPRRLYRQRVKI